MPDASATSRASRGRVASTTGTQSLAIVGLACRFPDADDPAALLDVVLTGRRSFRRLPAVRIDLADYYQPERTISDATYSTRAGLLEGWQFEPEAFGVDPATYVASDPAHWLALETTARALAAAGLPAGSGLDLDRTGVIIGNTLAGDTSRANALRVRWPYVRRVLTEALDTQEVPANQAGRVLRTAETSYLAPFPSMGPSSLAGSMPATIATTISAYFGCRGGSHAVDSACSSSLQAVASACAALAAGDLDAAIAGGVDISLDPLELIGLAKTGILATSDVRVYDREPTGYLPGEGCGVVVLMRTADARAADLPVYAEILGWGTSAGSVRSPIESQASAQVLAMQRAYDRAAIDPTEIQFIEGNGAATAAGDAAELGALCTIRNGTRRRAAIGSIKANIGHAKAAAGAAGLIKTVLALGTGVVPPTTGVHEPHELIAGGDAGLVLPQSPEEWPNGPRLAAVSTMGIGGSNVHLVLRHQPDGPRHRQDGWLRSVPSLARTLPKPNSEGVQPRLQPEPEPTPFLVHARDKFALASLLTRIADVARSLSDAELQDLACTLGRDPGQQGQARVGLVATRQDQLALLAREAVTLLPDLADGLITARPGIFASDTADGRVTLLLSGDASAYGGDIEDSRPGPVALTSGIAHCLDMLRWLDSLEVQATAAVGHGIGALAGLAWAGVLGEAEVIEIADLRAQYLLRAAELADSGPGASPTGHAGRLSGDPGGAVGLRSAIAQRFRFGPPRRRLISTMTGAEIESVDDAIDLICNGFSGAQRLSEAVAAGAVGATLLVETGPGRLLVSAAGRVTRVPAISLQSGFTHAENSSSVAAALFAAGALEQPKPLLAGRPARPMDIWREHVFITSPCQVAPQVPLAGLVPAQAGAIESTTGPASVHDIASKRSELERRLPARPRTETEDAAEPPTTEVEAALVAEPTAAVDASPSDTAIAATEDSALVSADSTMHAEGPAVAAQPDAAPEPATAGLAGPDGDEPAPAGDDESAIANEPVVLGAAMIPAEPAAPWAAFEVAVPRGKTRRRINGLGPWARCFTEGLRPVSTPEAPVGPGSWRVHAAATTPTLTEISSLFDHDAAAARTVAILDDPTDEASRIAAIKAAKDVIETGRLVVVTTSGRFTGFFASVHAEHSQTGITMLRVPAGGVGGDAIRQHAVAGRGQFREVVLDEAGVAREPVLAEVPVKSGGDPALGPEDVIVISRGAGGAGLALAQVLAVNGTGVAIVGRAGEYDDAELVTGLEELRSAGARIGYEVIEVGDKVSLTAAIRRIEDRLGTVTALAHGTGTDDPVPVAELTDARVRMAMADELSTLELLVRSIRPGQLKLLISVGTVSDRYGLAASGLHALCTGALAVRAGQLADASADCLHLHLDVPAWRANGLGNRPELAVELAAADAPPLEVNVVSRLLLKLLRTPGRPASVALHSRVGGLPAAPAQVITGAELTAAGLTHGGRFLREVDVHYPGVELVCSATLSLASDPYLADYRIDGMPMLPPVLALEALAQAASVLAGRPIRRATHVRLDSPILIPSGGAALLRVYALRNGNRIVTALRCADSSYRIDHARAEFNCAPTLPGVPDMPEAAFAAASPALQQLVSGPADLVDGAELYGPISFQSGRFRRIALLPEVTARSGRALARGADEHPWYPVGSELAGTEFLLGSPALNDATLQVLQACVPHRRVRPAACESVQFAGHAVDGPVEIRAIAEPVRWPGGGDDRAGAVDIADAGDGRRVASRADVDDAGTSFVADPSVPEPAFGPESPSVPEPAFGPEPPSVPEPRFVPAQAAAPGVEITSPSAQARDLGPASLKPPVEIPGTAGPEKPPDPEVAEHRPQPRKYRKARKSRGDQTGGSARRSGTSLPALHTWEVPTAALARAPQRSPSTPEGPPLDAQPPAGRVSAADSQITAVLGGHAPAQDALAAQSSAARSQAARRVSALTPPSLVPQLWNVEAVDASGQLVATWRGVRLHDSGPLPRNATWPPSLLSVYLERSAIDLGLDEGLRVTVSFGQADALLLDAATGVPRQPAAGDDQPPRRGRHAGPEQRAMNTASALGSGALAGFGLALRAPVPVACAWTPVEPGHRQRELSSPMASAFAQLRAELGESPAELSARLDAVGACLATAGLVPEDQGPRQLSVVRTTGDGWAVLALGRAHIASVVIDMSGVPAPIAIAMLTRRYAHARVPQGLVAAPVSTS